jgi:hypothetical protein
LDERAHRAFVLELAQFLRLPPGDAFQKAALKTQPEEAEAFIRSGDEEDWLRLQRNCLERVREVMQNLDVLTRKSA